MRGRAAWRVGRVPPDPRWLPLFRANFAGAPNPVPAKAALVAMGIIERDDLRAPLLPLADAPRERLVELLRDLGLVDGGGRVAEGTTGGSTTRGRTRTRQVVAA